LTWGSANGPDFSLITARNPLVFEPDPDYSITRKFSAAPVRGQAVDLTLRFRPSAVIGEARERLSRILSWPKESLRIEYDANHIAETMDGARLLDLPGDSDFVVAVLVPLALAPADSPRPN
jgi:hypothetical protein